MSRTFGDIEAKRPRFGGNPNVVISEPEIRSFRIQPHFDFILLGCDGIFDRLTNADCINAVWEATQDLFNENSKSVHSTAGYTNHNTRDQKKKGNSGGGGGIITTHKVN